MNEKVEVAPSKSSPIPGDLLDIIVIGAGPAGMSAAICASRANLNVLLIEKAIPGGEISTSWKIDNYLGFPGGILGDELAKRMERQLDDYNFFHTYESVEDIQSMGPFHKVVTTDLGNTYISKTIIICVGLEPKKLDEKFESRFLGRGISYFAQSDVSSYAGKNVVVLGGGNCACYAADYLAEHVNHITMVHSNNYLKAVRSLKSRIESHSKISIMWNSEMTELFGIDKVEKVKLTNLITGQHTWIDTTAVFVYIGRIPPTEILHVGMKTDEKGFIVTDEYMRTSIPGIYAAGDIRSKQIRQIATAVSDGMIAAINAERDLG